MMGKISLICTFVLFSMLLGVNGAPPLTWREHWFEHNQNLQRVFMNNEVAVYFDNDVVRSITWPNNFLTNLWRYVKRVYGNFGPENNLYAIFHARKYGGGHPSTYFDVHHDYRNVIDVGSLAANAWTSGKGSDLDIISHEVAHIVEIASQGTLNSPAFRIWGDSTWAEIFNYDAYLGLGMTSDSTRWHSLMMNSRQNFPRPNTYWFRDWWFPIYSQNGRTAVLSRFFILLSQNFPKNGKKYSRDMNMGEFIHFWSGAARKNLQSLATKAFGWTNEMDAQFRRARADFPRITY